MFCSKCGSQVQDGVAYCPQCGAPMATGFSNNTSSNFSNNVGYQPNPTYGSSPVTSKSSNMNMVRIIASILVIIATFMPYISAMGFSVKLFGDGRDGIYTL